VTAGAAVQPLGVSGARARLARTPGRLRLAGAVLATTAIGFGAIATTAAISRGDAADSVASSSEPQLVRAESLYASLSDADATAATTFLTGGIEPAERRQRYIADLGAASSRLDELSRRAGNSVDTRGAATALATLLPVYTGLIEAARSNNRQGFPVGAAYLRRASELMRTRILPAAERLYVVEAHRTDADYRAGTRNTGLIAAIVAGSILLALLLLTQLGLARFTNRLLNIPLLAATAILVGLGVWIVASLVSEQTALASAQREGSDSVQLLSASRVLALRAQRDESLALVGRGSDTTSLEDFDRAIAALRGTGPGGGLLGEAERAAARSGSAAGVLRLRAALTRLEDVHRDVASRERSGDFAGAVRTYIARELPQAERVDAGLEAQTRAAQRRFASNADDATGSVTGLKVAIPLLAVVIAGLALQGLAARIREYR
jgi:hypothetical protein